MEEVGLVTTQEEELKSWKRGEKGKPRRGDREKESRLDSRWAEAKAAGLRHELVRAWETVGGKVLRPPGWPSGHWHKTTTVFPALRE